LQRLVEQPIIGLRSAAEMVDLFPFGEGE